MATTVPDQEKVEAFAGRVIGDFAGTMATVLSILGDRLGLLRLRGVVKFGIDSISAPPDSLPKTCPQRIVGRSHAAGNVLDSACSSGSKLPHRRLLDLRLPP